MATTTKTKMAYKVVPDSLREDTAHQSNGRSGRRSLPIDESPWFRKLLDGKTVFVPIEQPKGADTVDMAWKARIYARFYYGFGRKLHAVWQEYRGMPGVKLWLDPPKGRKAT